MQLIQDHFDFLVRDHWFVRRSSVPAVTTYDLSFMAMLTRISIRVDSDATDLEIECGWPDQQISPSDPPPMVTLTEIVAMRAPDVEVPRDISTEGAAGTTLARSAELLREHAIDLLSGGSGLWFDFVDWKRANGDMGEGRWWGHPVYGEIGEVTSPRTRDDISRDMEFEPIHARVHRDPERAWPDIVAFVRRHPATFEGEMLIEDLVSGYGAAFIDRIEDLVRDDPLVRATVAQMTEIGGDASDAAARFNDLLDSIRETDT
jgi:hypothetical protein